MEVVSEKISIEKYPAYKNSGVEWLGEVPEHWEVSRLGKILTATSIKNHSHLPLLSITREKGVILRDMDDEEENHNFIPDDLSNYKLLKEDEFGMNKMKAWQGSYGISSFTGIVSPAYYTFTLDSNIVPDFFHLAIRSKIYVSFFASASDGVRVGQWDLSKERMKQIPFLIPSVEEQTAIADFLDRKTAQIDKAIAQKEKLIELLKERRQILIHEAVTRGLDKNMKTKDSGVEWIGQIPEHWEVKRIKHLGKMVNGYAFNSDSFSDKGIRVMKISNIQTMAVDWNDESFIDEKYYDQLPQYRVCQNDLVFALTRPIISSGIKAAVIKSNERILLNQRNAMLKPFLHLKHKWFYYILLNRHFEQAFDNEIDKTGQQPNISTTSIGNLKIPLPDLNEQNEIIEYLDDCFSKFLKAMESAQREIDKLKEYKTTLINAAVTGKIKVN